MLQQKTLTPRLKRNTPGVRLIKHRLEEDNQIQLAGYLNLPTTGKLPEYLDKKNGGKVIDILDRHNKYREQNFGVADKNTKLGEAPKLGTWSSKYI